MQKLRFISIGDASSMGGAGGMGGGDDGSGNNNADLGDSGNTYTLE